MRSSFLRFLSALLITAGCSVIASSSLFAQCSNSGNEFYVGFSFNDPKQGGQTSDLFLRLYLTSAFTTTVRVQYAGAADADYTVTANMVTSVAIPEPAQVHAGDVGSIVDKGIHVYSLDGIPFTCYMMSRRDASTDAATCIPVDGVGTRYRIASMANVANPEIPCAFLIVATEDSTVVTYTKPGKAPKRLARPLTKRECFYEEDILDLSGTLVVSNKPITVFSGHQCLNTADGACDFITEQLLPTTSWGRYFNVMRFGSNGTRDVAAFTGTHTNAGDNIRVYCDFDSTKIYIDGTLKATKNAGQFYETAINPRPPGTEDKCVVNLAHEIYATKPVQVVQICNGQCKLVSGNGICGTTGCPESGDPSEVVIPAVGQYIPKTTFSTPQIDVGPFFANYLDVIVPTKYTNNVQLRDSSGAATPLDSSALICWLPIPRSFNTLQYSYTHYTLPRPGAYTLEWKTLPPKDERNNIMAYQYGFSGSDSYAYASGFSTYPGPKIAFTFQRKNDALDFDTLLCASPNFKDKIISAVDSCYPKLILSGAKIVGADSGSFSIISPLDTIYPRVVDGLSSGPQDKLDYTIRFAPKKFGLNNATLNIYSNDEQRPVTSIALRGFLDTTDLQAITAPITFNNVPATTTVNGNAQFKIVGHRTATISNVFFSPASFPGVVTNYPPTATPGVPFTVDYKVTPTAATTYTGKLVVVTNDPCIDTAFIPITVKGTNGGVTAAGKDYGERYSCQSPKLDSISVTNGGSIAGTITNYTLTGPSDFIAVSPATGTQNIPIAAGETKYFTIRFSPGLPTGAKTATATINLTIGGNPTTTTATVQGIAGQQSVVERPKLDFNLVEIGTYSPDSILSVANNSSGAIRIDSIALPAGFYFNGTPPFPITVNAGQTFKANVQFYPTQERIYTGDAIVYIGSVCPETKMIPMQGEGTKPLRAVCLQPSITALAGKKPGEPITITITLRDSLNSKEDSLQFDFHYDVNQINLDEKSLALSSPNCGAVTIVSHNIETGTMRLLVTGCSKNDILKAGSIITIQGSMLLSPFESGVLMIDSLKVPSTKYRYYPSTAANCLQSAYVVDQTCIQTSTLKLKSSASAMLLGNFPNPFDTKTSIRVSVIRSTSVAIEIFNSFGEHVASVGDGRELKKGIETFIFDRSLLAAGVYFVRLTTSDGHIESASMVIAPVK